MSPRKAKAAPKPKAPDLPVIDTWSKALAWMEEQGKAVWGPEFKSAREALFWFVSWQEVGDVGDYSHRDIAWWFMHGLPKATVRSCMEWINDQRNTWNEDSGEPMGDGAGAYDLRYELQDFWGVKS